MDRHLRQPNPAIRLRSEATAGQVASWLQSTRPTGRVAAVFVQALRRAREPGALSGGTRMVHYEVLPLHGIGPVILGMSQHAVRGVMGIPSTSLPFRGRLAPVDSYHPNGFVSIQYDFDCRVQFIEVAPVPDVRFIYRGHDVFGTRADNLIGFIEADAAINTSHHKFPKSVVVPSLELAFWRHCLPEESGGPEGLYFESLAVGIPGYYSRAA